LKPACFFFSPEMQVDAENTRKSGVLLGLSLKNYIICAIFEFFCAVDELAFLLLFFPF